MVTSQLQGLEGCCDDSKEDWQSVSKSVLLMKTEWVRPYWLDLKLCYVCGWHLYNLLWAPQVASVSLTINIQVVFTFGCRINRKNFLKMMWV
jgi:hypothetical protein